MSCSHTFIVEHNTKIVATYGLFPLNNSSVEIRKMYASPSIRGKGLGKWMVNHLIEIARKNDYDEVELESASQLKEAIGLYQKFGFIEKDFENCISDIIVMTEKDATKCLNFAKDNWYYLKISLSVDLELFKSIEEKLKISS